MGLEQLRYMFMISPGHIKESSSAICRVCHDHRFLSFLLTDVVVKVTTYVCA